MDHFLEVGFFIQCIMMYASPQAFMTGRCSLCVICSAPLPLASSVAPLPTAAGPQVPRIARARRAFFQRGQSWGKRGGRVGRSLGTRGFLWPTPQK